MKVETNCYLEDFPDDLPYVIPDEFCVEVDEKTIRMLVNWVHHLNTVESPYLTVKLPIREDLADNLLEALEVEVGNEGLNREDVADMWIELGYGIKNVFKAAMVTFHFQSPVTFSEFNYSCDLGDTVGRIAEEESPY